MSTDRIPCKALTRQLREAGTGVAGPSGIVYQVHPQTGIMGEPKHPPGVHPIDAAEFRQFSKMFQVSGAPPPPKRKAPAPPKRAAPPPPVAAKSVGLWGIPGAEIWEAFLGMDRMDMESAAYERNINPDTKTDEQLAALTILKAGYTVDAIPEEHRPGYVAPVAEEPAVGGSDPAEPESPPSELPAALAATIAASAEDPQAAALPVPPRVSEPITAPVPDPPEPRDPYAARRAELADMGRGKLRKLASELDIPGRSKLEKPELRDAILAAEIAVLP